MTTDPIPDDIREKAEDLCADLDIFPTYSTVTAIAQALMQERDRAVRRFLTAADVLAEDNQALSIAAITAIGKAIRSPDKTP